MKKITFLVALIGLLASQTVGQITNYPYLEDFENGPGGWTANNITNGSWAFGTPQGSIINSASSGVNAWVTNLTGNYNTNEVSWVQSPIFDFTTLAAPQIAFNIWWTAETGFDGMVLQSSIDGGLTWQNVGAFGDPMNWFNSATITANPGGQSQGWTGSGSSSSGTWVSASHDISSLAGQSAVFFRFAFASDLSVQNNGFAFDDILISELLCAQPNNLSASNIVGTSADLSWVEAGTATQWDIEYGGVGFSPTGTPTLAGITTNPYTLTGLAPSTTYDFYVRADCGGSNGVSNWSGPYTFTTPCATQSAPYMDDIEAHAPTTTLTFSNCWFENSSGAYDWNVDGSGSTPSSGTGPTGAYSGSNYFYVEASGSTLSDTAYLLSPNIDLSTLTTPSIEFYYHMYGFNMGDLFIDVYDGTWTTVDSLMGQQQIAQADPWLKRTIDISSFSGVIQVRFRAASAGTFRGDICLDDIQVKEFPTCFDPVTLLASNITTNSADLSWVETGTATAWDIEHGVAGFTPTGTPTIVATTSNPHTITGLIPATSYDFYVRANCGVTNGNSSWVGPYNYMTLCAQMITPWIDSVEAHTPTTSLTLSNCWEAINSSAYNWNIDGSGSTPSSGTGPAGAYSGTNYFYIEGSGGSTNDTALLVSPLLDLSPLNAAGLEFYYHMYGLNMGSLFVDVFDGTSWTNDIDSIIGQQQTSQADPWLMKQVDLSGFSGVVRIRFRAIKAGSISGDISIDDIAIIETLTCPQPDSLVANNNGNNSVDLSWNETGSATLWEIEYDTLGFVPGTGTAFLTGSNPHTLGGLTANTNYAFYVRSICAQADSSAWAGPFSFNTTSVGLSDVGLDNQFKLLPNPNTGVFTLQLNSQNLGDVTLEILDATGQQVVKKIVHSKETKINEVFDLSQHAKGLYFMKVTFNKGTQATPFFVQ